MSQLDNVIQMLSERRVGSRLKSISLKENQDTPISVIKFTFEGKENEERIIGISGKDLNIYFGSVV